jgi:thiol-disulfide isomerase/thioredoxin
MKFTPNSFPIKLSKDGWLTLAAMFLVIVLIIAYFVFRDQSLVQKHKETPAAKALIIEDDNVSFTDLEDNKISLNKDFGNVLVVMSWASWCPQCGKDLEALGNMAKDYQGKDVSIMAINRAEDRYSAERFLNTLQVPSELRIILDPNDHYFANSEGYAMPETLVYSLEGNVILQQRGELKTDELKNAIDSELNN